MGIKAKGQMERITLILGEEQTRISKKVANLLPRMRHIYEQVAIFPGATEIYLNISLIEWELLHRFTAYLILPETSEELAGLLKAAEELDITPRYRGILETHVYQYLLRIGASVLDRRLTLLDLYKKVLDPTYLTANEPAEPKRPCPYVGYKNKVCGKPVPEGATYCFHCQKKKFRKKVMEVAAKKLLPKDMKEVESPEEAKKSHIEISYIGVTEEGVSLYRSEVDNLLLQQQEGNTLKIIGIYMPDGQTRPLTDEEGMYFSVKYGIPADGVVLDEE
jgi:hypothetical protein